MSRAVPDVSGFQFGTKAETLARLRERLESSWFCEQFVFTTGRWMAQPCDVIDEVLARVSGQELVFRSSRLGEDGANESMAGAFESVIGVARTRDSIKAAASRVIESYGRIQGEDQVLVQPRLMDVDLSGVVTTRKLDTGAPYYVINYDDTTGRTDSVTGGAQSKTVLVHRERAGALRSTRLSKLLRIVRSIEATVESSELDIEFAIVRDRAVYILQVRPIAASRNWSRVDDGQVDGQIEKARHLFRSASTRLPGQAGPIAIFGQMPDWNPAEMIGSLPRPLAYSLYRSLITDQAWAVARQRMGYKDMRGVPLMHAFADQPYIDVRASLNSFLPEGLEPSIAERLVDSQLERLASNRELHDRIEFAIAIPNMDFSFEERRPELEEAGLTSGEIASFHDRLVALTRRLVENGAEEMGALDRITEALTSVAASPVKDRTTLAALLDRGRFDGAIPFAMLARHGFIGVSYLKSLVKCGVLTRDRVDAFIGTIKTVAAEFIEDLHGVHSGLMDRERFLEIYGHLRPGTYDINSPRYDRAPDLYLSGRCEKPAERGVFEFSTKDLDQIERHLDHAGLRIPVEKFLDYVREGIRLRELAKFRFTVVVSRVIEAVAEIGAGLGLSRDEMSYLDIDEILQGNADELPQRIAQRKGKFKASHQVCLPHLIIEARDFDVVRVPLNTPTFITSRRVTSPARRLEASGAASVEGCIVLIESADPGFDWIFSHGIKGLITKYGGANSHMAIRCAEFQLPAAIGCGERLYGSLVRANMIELNCAAQLARAVS